MRFQQFGFFAAADPHFQFGSPLDKDRLRFGRKTQKRYGIVLLLCAQGQPSAEGSSGDDATTDVWLFNVTADPTELCNLAAARPQDVQRLMGRLKQLNATAVPASNPPNDPRSLPKKGGAWGPWMK